MTITFAAMDFHPSLKSMDYKENFLKVQFPHI